MKSPTCCHCCAAVWTSSSSLESDKSGRMHRSSRACSRLRHLQADAVTSSSTAPPASQSATWWTEPALQLSHVSTIIKLFIEEHIISTIDCIVMLEKCLTLAAPWSGQSILVRIHGHYWKLVSLDVRAQSDIAETLQPAQAALAPRQVVMRSEDSPSLPTLADFWSPCLVSDSSRCTSWYLGKQVHCSYNQKIDTLSALKLAVNITYRW